MAWSSQTPPCAPVPSHLCCPCLSLGTADLQDSSYHPAAFSLGAGAVTPEGSFCLLLGHLHPTKPWSRAFPAALLPPLGAFPVSDYQCNIGKRWQDFRESQRRCYTDRLWDAKLLPYFTVQVAPQTALGSGTEPPNALGWKGPFRSSRPTPYCDPAGPSSGSDEATAAVTKHPQLPWATCCSVSKHRQFNRRDLEVKTAEQILLKNSLACSKDAQLQIYLIFLIKYFKANESSH